LKVSTNVKIAMQCFENFGGKYPKCPPPWLRAWFNLSIRLVRHFFVGPGRIPIFCVHLYISVRLIRNRQFVASFCPSEAFCSANSSFAVSVLMFKQLTRVGIQTN